MTARLLIVDDNRELAENLSEILEGQGYATRVFVDPEEVLATPSLAFDAALIDVRMPRMDGVDLHARLAPEHPDARFFLMTAYAPDDRLAAALRAGVRKVFPKPVPISELFAELPPAREAAGGT